MTGKRQRVAEFDTGNQLLLLRGDTFIKPGIMGDAVVQRQPVVANKVLYVIARAVGGVIALRQTDTVAKELLKIDVTAG